MRPGRHDTYCSEIRLISGRSVDDVAVLVRLGPHDEIVDHIGADNVETLLFRVRAGAARCVYRTSDLLRSMHLDRAGTLWAGQYDHLLRFDEAGPTRPEIPAKVITVLADGRVFCAAEQLVRQVDGERVVELPPLPEEVRVLASDGTRSPQP